MQQPKKVIYLLTAAVLAASVPTGRLAAQPADKAPVKQEKKNDTAPVFASLKKKKKKKPAYHTILAQLSWQNERIFSPFTTKNRNLDDRSSYAGLDLLYSFRLWRSVWPEFGSSYFYRDQYEHGSLYAGLAFTFLYRPRFPLSVQLTASGGLGVAAPHFSRVNEEHPLANVGVRLRYLWRILLVTFAYEASVLAMGEVTYGDKTVAYHNPDISRIKLGLGFRL